MPINATVSGMKRYLAELIYSSAHVEGVAATFAQTQEIIARGCSAGLDDEDISKILGLKRAWEYLFAHYDEPLSWQLFSSYNSLIGEGTVRDAGKMRPPGSVHVDGVYVPPDDISEDKFERIVCTAVDTNKGDPGLAATTMLLLLAKNQFFYDGNKRAAQLLANHFLAHADAGLFLRVPEPEVDRFLEQLMSFYRGEISLNDAAWDLSDLAIGRCAPRRTLSDRELWL